MNADLKIRSSELVKKQNCVKLGAGYSFDGPERR